VLDPFNVAITEGCCHPECGKSLTEKRALLSVGSELIIA